MKRDREREVYDYQDLCKARILLVMNNRKVTPACVQYLNIHVLISKHTSIIDDVPTM